MRPRREEAVSAEHELALAMCATRARREESEERVRQLAATVQAGQLASVLDSQRLLPLVGGRLVALAPDAFPDSFHTLVSGARRIYGAHAIGVDAIGQALQRALEQAGIDALPLKGPSLGRRLYGDLSTRAATDVDLLMRRTRLDEAVAIAVARGYDTPRDPLVADGLPQLHYTLEPCADWMPPVELHWRVHWYETEFSREMLDASAPDPVAGRKPSAEHDLAALLLFFTRDGFIGLRYAADIATWWDLYRHELPAGGLSELLASHPELAPALRAAATVSASLGGPPAQRVLGDDRPLSAREARAVRLANWTGGDGNPQLYANRSLVDWVLRPPNTVRAYARRQLRPPPEVIARMYDLPESARLRRRVWSVLHGPKYLLRLGAAAMYSRESRTAPPRRAQA